MELKSITIRNFKALQDIHLTEIPNFMVLVGANGTGKSTLFDVFGFLRDALTGNVRQALDARGRFSEVVTRGHEKESILVELQVSLPIAGKLRLVTYHLEIGLEDGRPVVLHEFLRYKRGRYGAPFYFLDFHNGSGFAIGNEEDFDKPTKSSSGRNSSWSRQIFLPSRAWGNSSASGRLARCVSCSRTGTS